MLRELLSGSFLIYHSLTSRSKHLWTKAFKNCYGKTASILFDVTFAMGSVDSVSLGKGSLLMTGTHSNAIFQSPVISISSQILRSKERKLFLLHCHFDKEAILGGNEGLAMIEGRKRNSQYWLSLQSIKVLDVRSACARSDISSCNRR